MNSKIFNFIYNEAMTDAIRRTDCKGCKEVLMSSDEAKVIVKEYVDNTINGKKPDFYDVARRLTEDLKSKDKRFTFGNAQKLINITIKHFYLLVYKTDNENPASMISRDVFAGCHCPMDRTMIRKVVLNYRAAIQNDPIEREKKIDCYINEAKTCRDWSNIAWSKIDYPNIELYERYQAMVTYLCNKGIYPLEYDYLHFMP